MAVRLSINPEALKWVKNGFGLSDAEMSTKFLVSESTYKEFERGIKKPSLRQLRNAAKRLKTPLAVFYLKSLPNGEPLPHDYRNRANERPLSIRTRLQIRRARSSQEFLARTERWPVFDTARFSSSDPLDIAKKIREYLKYSPSQRVSKDKLFETIRSGFEKMGVLTLVLSLNTKEARGFSIQGQPPVIVVSSSDAKSAQIFTLLHEFAHLIKNRTGLCQPFEKVNSNTETFCNRIASNFLILPDELKEVLKGYFSLDNDRLRLIADMFKTSREVLLISMIENNFASWSDYLQKKGVWDEEYKSHKRFFSQPNPTSKALKENGAELVSIVAEQVRKDRLSYIEAADFLNVNAGYLDKVGEKVGANL